MNKIIRRPLPLYYRGMPFPEVAPKAVMKARQFGDNADLAWQMVQGDRTYSFDANMGLSDGTVSYTTNGFAQYQGADGIVDLGGNQQVTITLPSIADVSTITPQQARIDAVCVIDITAITTTGSALEKLILVGSNDPNFGAGNVQMLGMLEFGNSTVLDTINGFTTPAPAAVGGSRYEMPFAAEQNNVKYEYAKLYNVITGSGAITYRAFIAVLPEP